MTGLDPSFKSYLPSKKIYLSRMTGQDFFQALSLSYTAQITYIKYTNLKREYEIFCVQSKQKSMTFSYIHFWKQLQSCYFLHNSVYC